MDHLHAAQLLGVAEYTVTAVEYDAASDEWVVSVRDMARHETVQRRIPAEDGNRPAPAVEAEEVSHGEALIEMADDAQVPDGTVAEVLDWVGDNDVRAFAAKVVEEEREKPRKTLVDALQAKLDAANATDSADVAQ